MEKLVDAMAAVGLDHAAVPLLGNFLDCVTIVSEESAGLDELDRLFETVTSRLDNTHAVRILVCLADVVCLVEIAVEAAMVKCNVDVKNVAVLQRALIGDTVADDLVG